MPFVVLDQLVFNVLLALLFAELFGVLWTWLWAIRRAWLGIPLMEAPGKVPARPVPWGMPTIGLTIFLYLLITISITSGYASLTGRSITRDHAQVVEAPVIAPGADEIEAPADEKPEHQTPGELMLQSSVINGLVLILIPALLFRVSGATLKDLGWDPTNWQRQAFYGMRAAMLMTPVVFAIQALAIKIWEPQKHPLEMMVSQKFSAGLALLAIVSATVLAPLAEELLFRGIVQQWLVRVFDYFPRYKSFAENHLSENVESERNHPEIDLGPVEAGAGRAPEVVETGSQDAPAIPAIVVTSLLFAGMHDAQWPAPVAIFFLSLWLGTVFHQSRSLISAVALHATFNSFSTLMILLQSLGRRIENGRVPALLSQILEFFT